MSEASNNEYKFTVTIQGVVDAKSIKGAEKEVEAHIVANLDNIPSNMEVAQISKDTYLNREIY